MNDASGTERMAQLEKAVLQALELLDRADVEAARDELLRVAPATAPEPADTISEQELDAAFADASAEVDQMLDADEVALQAVEAADVLPESELEELTPAEVETPMVAGDFEPVAPDAPIAVEADVDSPRADEIGDRFATATMAELLARQGDEGAASRIRATLEPGAAPDEENDERTSRDHVVQTLESWLSNLRGGARA